MKIAELKHLTDHLVKDLREGRFDPDWDLGKSEYLGESQEMAAAYEALARPVLDAYLERRMVTEDERAELLTLADDRQALADKLQTLAEILAVDVP